MRALTLIATIVLGQANSAPPGPPDRLRILSANPVSYCQAPLSAFDGQIRKRPLAMQNEGTSNAFVTCAFTRQVSDPRNFIFLVQMFASNAGTSPQDLACTLVTGTGEAISPDNIFIPKTVTIMPGVSRALLQWDQGDLAAITTVTEYSLSCNLPPSTALNDSHIYFFEPVLN